MKNDEENIDEKNPKSKYKYLRKKFENVVDKLKKILIVSRSVQVFLLLYFRTDCPLMKKKVWRKAHRTEH